MIRRFIFRAFVVLLIGAAIFAVKALYDAGAFRTIQPHFGGKAVVVPGIMGPEDVEYSEKYKTLFISSDHRPEEPGQATPDGGIYAWGMEPGARPRLLVPLVKLDFEFHPHGIAIQDLPDGVRIWAVSHRLAETTIEVFLWKSGSFTFERTLKDPLLMNANDLVAVDQTRFYTTHDHGSASPRLARLEDYTRIGRGYITFFDGTHFTVKEDGIRFANGIVFSGDPAKPETKLLVASMLGKAVQVYGRDVSTANLTLEHEIDLDSCPDNLSRDAAGDIWIGAHPKMLSLKAMNEDRHKKSPAVVYRLSHVLSASPQIEEVFVDDGSKLSAASVAFHLGNRLIIGSVFDDHLLDCAL
jgi:arylesterase/paraoxonase